MQLLSHVAARFTSIVYGAEPGGSWRERRRGPQISPGSNLVDWRLNWPVRIAHLDATPDDDLPTTVPTRLRSEGSRSKAVLPCAVQPLWDTNLASIHRDVRQRRRKQSNSQLRNSIAAG